MRRVDDGSPAVYVLEPQSLFVPALQRAIARAGGDVVQISSRVDRSELETLRGDFILADVDYLAGGRVRALASLRSAAPTVPIIVLTDSLDHKVVSEFIAAGASSVLGKSVDETELSAALKQIFRRTSPDGDSGASFGVR